MSRDTQATHVVKRHHGWLTHPILRSIGTRHDDYLQHIAHSSLSHKCEYDLLGICSQIPLVLTQSQELCKVFLETIVEKKLGIQTSHRTFTSRIIGSDSSFNKLLLHLL